MLSWKQQVLTFAKDAQKNNLLHCYHITDGLTGEWIAEDVFHLTMLSLHFHYQVYEGNALVARRITVDFETSVLKYDKDPILPVIYELVYEMLYAKIVFTFQ